MSVSPVARRLGIATDPANREKDDYYITAPEKLLSVEKFDGPVWEPCCGEGHISRVLLDAGYDVVSTDLVDRGYGEPRVDFLLEWRTLAPNIVTNPPFALIEDFMRTGLAADDRQDGLPRAARRFVGWRAVGDLRAIATNPHLELQTSH
jgi:hypothetical protein